MRLRTPNQPTPLAPTQVARLRVLDIRLLATSAAVYLAFLALTFTPWPIWIILPLTIAAYTPVVVQFIHFRASLNLKHTQPLIPEYPRNLLHTGAFMSYAMLLGICMVALVTGEASVFMLLFMPCIGLALTLLNASNFSFALSPPSCPSCHYTLEGLTFPISCPECGHSIDSKSEAITCRKLQKPGLRAAGVACFVLPLLGSTVVSANPGVFTTRLPRPARLAIAPTDTAAFNSIVGTLTPEERDLLITRILDARADDNMWLMVDQLNWLSAEHSLGNLSPEQAERFASEPLRFDIQTDTIRRVGLPMRITITGQTPAAPYNAHSHFIYFTRGFEINGTMHLIDPPRHFSQLSLRASGIDPKTDQLIPHITYTPDQPGPLTIRASIIAVTTISANPTITWRNDGTYLITPEPLTTHEITAEITLEIDP